MLHILEVETKDINKCLRVFLTNAVIKGRKLGQKEAVESKNMFI